MLNMYGGATVDFVQIFRQEFRLLEAGSRLPSHPNVLSVLHTFEDDASGLPEWDYDPTIVFPHTTFIVMPYLQDSLHKRIKHCPQQADPMAVLPPAEVIPYFLQLLSVATHLGKHRVAHRDMKPDNVMIGADGKV